MLKSRLYMTLTVLVRWECMLASASSTSVVPLQLRHTVLYRSGQDGEVGTVRDDVTTKVLQDTTR